jgi:lipid-A-disaccharide synthase-like uncharacterized protein
MAMTDKENVMIEDFFKQAAQQQIEDNGFTEWVMRSLPDRKGQMVRRLSQLWTLFCIAVAGVLFFLFGGWQVVTGLFFASLKVILGWLEVQMVTATTTEIPVNLWAILLLGAMVLVYLPYQTARKLSATL